MTTCHRNRTVIDPAISDTYRCIQVYPRHIEVYVDSPRPSSGEGKIQLACFGTAKGVTVTRMVDQTIHRSLG